MTSSVVIEEKIKFTEVYPKEVDIDVDNIIKFSHHSTTTTPEVYVDKENECLLIINFRSERTCKERLPKYLILISKIDFDIDKEDFNFLIILTL